MAASEATVAAARCTGLAVDYRTAAGVVHALQDVDASFGRGQLSVVAGPSGSGKSSLLRVLAGLQHPRAGTVEIGDADVTRLRPRLLRRLRRRTIGMVLQDPSDNLVGYLPAIEQVRLAAALRGVDPGETASLLDTTGLSDRAASYPHELSGGEQQRVAFAAAAIGPPTLLLADEPTAELDAVAGARLVEAMADLVRRGATLVVTSHDPAVIAAADHVVALRDGRVEPGGVGVRERP
ncbi:MAG: ABC transporter ATP-binding protein [Acidimicrobiales bacterium]